MKKNVLYKGIWTISTILKSHYLGTPNKWISKFYALYQNLKVIIMQNATGDAAISAINSVAIFKILYQAKYFY